MAEKHPSLFSEEEIPAASPTEHEKLGSSPEDIEEELEVFEGHDIPEPLQEFASPETFEAITNRILRTRLSPPEHAWSSGDTEERDLGVWKLEIEEQYSHIADELNSDYMTSTTMQRIKSFLDNLNSYSRSGIPHHSFVTDSVYLLSLYEKLGL